MFLNGVCRRLSSFDFFSLFLKRYNLCSRQYKVHNIKQFLKITNRLASQPWRPPYLSVLQLGNSKVVQYQLTGTTEIRRSRSGCAECGDGLSFLVIVSLLFIV